MHHRWKWFFAFAAVLLALAGSIPANAGVPDPAQSFYVPEIGPVATSTSAPVGGFGVEAVTACLPPCQQGTLAINQMIMCPNNDVTGLRSNNARLKVVVRASDGSPIANIPAADICAMFNGGTPAQGFSGVGDDSIIANSQFNGAASGRNCPDVRCVSADAPTNASGTTYITWAGSTPGSPGVSTRDPLRKWGGFAGNVPVMVLGFAIQGRLTTGGVPGSYTAHVKNVDLAGGRSTLAGDPGEIVNSVDNNAMNGAALAYKYFADFVNRSDTRVDSFDKNFWNGHTLLGGHRCNVGNAGPN